VIRKKLLTIFYAFAGISLITLAINPLLSDDAAMYALAIKNMILHNQWLGPLMTPGHLASFLDKPPLGLWLIGIFPKLLGTNLVTVHIGNVLFFGCILFFLYVGLKKMGRPKIALYATLIASTSFVLVVYSRTPKLDILLTLLLTMIHLKMFEFFKFNSKKAFFEMFLLMGIGFLIKSGFALVLPFLTFVFVYVLYSPQRKTVKIFSFDSILALGLLIAFPLLILGAQYTYFGEYWLSYLKSVTFTSKYHSSYLGLNLNLNNFGFLLVAIFPWTPLFLSTLKLKFKKRRFDLKSFCYLWFLSNFLFFLFLFKLTDLRSFTVLVPSLAILGAYRIQALLSNPRKWGHRFSKIWGVFFTIIFLLIPLGLIIDPKDPNGPITVITLLAFGFSQLVITFFIFKPSEKKLMIGYLSSVIAFSILYMSSSQIAIENNHFRGWVQTLKNYQKNKYQIVFYRPPGRNLIMTSDLAYVDFFSRKGSRYFWNEKSLQKFVNTNEEIVLVTNPRSYQKITHSRWEKLHSNKEAVLGVLHKKNVIPNN